MSIPEALSKYPVQLSAQLIRCWISKGSCPFGYIVNTGEQRNTYYINEAKLKLWIEGKI